VSRLVDRIRGEDRPGKMPGGTFIGGQSLVSPPSTPAGVVIDGAVYALEGEPPAATSKGWGDLGWLMWRRYY
jgi:hypothetical protein